MLLGGQAAAFAIPPEQPTLPELLSGAGYETAAFIANPTMHQGDGFGRGLDDLYISPPDTAFVTLEDELPGAQGFHLAARAGRASLLSARPLPAPHDPYANPVQFLGRSPSHPFYLGRITGSDVHELFLGALDLDDPGADVPHLRALYASEVRWVDRWVGALLEANAAERLRDTLVVLTADHGEEAPGRRGLAVVRTTKVSRRRSAGMSSSSAPTSQQGSAPRWRREPGGGARRRRGRARLRNYPREKTRARRCR